MTDPWLLGGAASVIVISMTLVWLVSLGLRNAGIVDVFWGLGFAILAGLGVWVIRDPRTSLFTPKKPTRLPLPARRVGVRLPRVNWFFGHHEYVGDV